MSDTEEQVELLDCPLKERILNYAGCPTPDGRVFLTPDGIIITKPPE